MYSRSISACTTAFRTAKPLRPSACSRLHFFPTFGTTLFYHSLSFSILRLFCSITPTNFQACVQANPLAVRTLSKHIRSLSGLCPNNLICYQDHIQHFSFLSGFCPPFPYHINDIFCATCILGTVAILVNDLNRPEFS